MNKLKILIASDGENTFVLFGDYFLAPEKVEFEASWNTANIRFECVRTPPDCEKERFFQLVKKHLGYEIKDVEQLSAGKMRDGQ